MLSLIFAATVAATPVPPAIDTPPRALDGLAVFEGTWTCESRPPDETDAKPVRSQMTIARELDGFWYTGRAVEERSETPARPATRLFFWSYDLVLGKFVGGWLDSRGGWSAQTAMDWENDTLTFLGHVTATGEKVTARETFTRPIGGTFRRRYEILGFTSWRLVRDETCRKQP